MTNFPTPTPGPDEREASPEKPSRAAEYIALLYVALVLCTPWLLRETPWLTPPSNGVEIQMSKKGQPAPERKAAAKMPADGANVPVRAN